MNRHYDWSTTTPFISQWQLQTCMEKWVAFHYPTLLDGRSTQSPNIRCPQFLQVNSYLHSPSMTSECSQWATTKHDPRTRQPEPSCHLSHCPTLNHYHSKNLCVTFSQAESVEVRGTPQQCDYSLNLVTMMTWSCEGWSSGSIPGCTACGAQLQPIEPGKYWQPILSRKSRQCRPTRLDEHIDVPKTGLVLPDRASC